MKVSVTQDDIDISLRYLRFARCARCPVSQAITRACDGMIAFVSQTEVHLVSGKRVKIVPLPHVAQEFISCFDFKKPVTPFDFDLDIESAQWQGFQ